MNTITYLLLTEQNFNENSLDDFLRHERLSQEDKLDGESNSIANQDGICQGGFPQKLQIVQ